MIIRAGFYVVLTNGFDAESSVQETDRWRTCRQPADYLIIGRQT